MTPLRRVLAFLVWLLALLVCVWLWSRRQPVSSAQAIVEEGRHRIAFEIDGVLQEVAARLHAIVDEGALLASLDTSVLQHELTQSKCELERLRAEQAREAAQIASEVAARPSERALDLRRLERDIETTHITLLQSLTTQEEDRVLLAGFELQLARSSKLADEDLGARSRFEVDATRRDATKRRIEEREATIAALRKNMASATERLEEARRETVEVDASVLLRPFEVAVAAQEARIAALTERLRRVSLKAPFRARVALVHARPGEFVAAGRPVLELIEEAPRFATGYVAPEHMARFADGVAVQLAARTAAGATARATTLVSARVEARGAVVELMPERLWLEGRIPRYGIAVRFALDPQAPQLYPGQVLDVIALEQR